MGKVIDIFSREVLTESDTDRKYGNGFINLGGMRVRVEEAIDTRRNVTEIAGMGINDVREQLFADEEVILKRYERLGMDKLNFIEETTNTLINEGRIAFKSCAKAEEILRGWTMEEITLFLLNAMEHLIRQKPALYFVAVGMISGTRRHPENRK